MCGIAGIINFEPNHDCLKKVEVMTRELIHRGPDEEGFWQDDRVFLGHRRLNIIDPKGGKQPFFAADGSIVLNYNGEVYNFHDIRRELTDYHFRTTSDTETIVAAYQKWGMNCLKKFRGMFAFSLYDKKQNKVYLVRDRLGIKPLYYHQTDNQVVFASELGACRKASVSEAKINLQALSAYLRYRYVPDPLSIYENFFKLEAGCYLSIDLTTKKIQKSRYWDLNVTENKMTEQDALEQWQKLLEDTVKLYLTSDVPVGTFLSGGMDSSLITRLVSNTSNYRVKAFGIDFSEEKFSEGTYIQAAAKICGADLTLETLTAAIAKNDAPICISHFGEPFCDSSYFAVNAVSKLAAKSVKVVLSGDGADEIFAGYWSYPITRKQTLDQVSKNEIQKMHESQREAFGSEVQQNLLCDTSAIFPSLYTFDQVTSLDPVTFYQTRDIKTYLCHDILTKVDRMSMAHSLEVRVPFLDHHVVEFALNLPLDLRLKDRTDGKFSTKYLLRKYSKKYFPEDFFERPKQGFGVPMHDWQKSAWQAEISTELLDKSKPIYAFIKYDFVKSLVEDYFGGKKIVAENIWLLYHLSFWLTQQGLK